MLEWIEFCLAGTPQHNTMHARTAVSLIYLWLWIKGPTAALIQENHKDSGLTTVPEILNIDVEYLILSKNSIYDITNTSLVSYPKLIRLDMDRNGLKRIHNGAFSNNPALQNLHFSYNSIVYIADDFGPARNSLVEARFFMAVKTPTELENMDFRHFPKLKMLLIGGNHLRKIDGNNLPDSLNYFALGWGYLTTMPNFRIYTPNISTIKLNQNSISHIPGESILGLRLEELNVQSNNIETIPDLYDHPLHALRIGNNPLCCNESLCWVRLWGRKKPALLNGLSSAVCSSPSSLENSLLQEADPVEMGCYKGQRVVILYIHTKLKSGQISFFHNILGSCEIELKCCPEHCSIRDWFKLNMHFCGKSFIASNPVSHRMQFISI